MNCVPSHFLRRRGPAFSLIELMCVMAIIAVLATMLLGPVSRAYQRARAFAGEMDSQTHIDELRLQLSKYVTTHPEFPTLTLNDLLQRCPVSSKCERFLRSKPVTFHPFGSSTPDPQIALAVDAGKAGVAVYSKAVLCSPPYYANYYAN